MKTVLTIGPNGGAQRYKSMRAASRALSGNGTDGLKSTISRLCAGNGGYVNNTFVCAVGSISTIRKPR
jgi:hypothetical protein